SDVTLNRFFALHVVALPLALIGLVVAHLLALHEVGSNNPDGVEIKKNKGADGHPVDGIPSHPYYTIKDIMGVAFLLLLFCGVVVFAPTMRGLFLEPANFEPANRLVTPPEIAPVWYFTPFYAILRAVPNKLAGVGLMGVAVVIFFFLPWLDRCKVKSIRYRSVWFKVALFSFAASFIVLGYLGMQPPTAPFSESWPIFTIAVIAALCYLIAMVGSIRNDNIVLIVLVLAFAAGFATLVYMALKEHGANALVNSSRIFSLVYFCYFLFMPFYTRSEQVKAVPDRVTYHAH
ncbi:MAG TPA: cytochrome b N-terminal domain-containing protein, partial [Steroidobacteraceae bacterium]|nr:cytochrome b N-terminal domain-containing protein [Steroidobacteraceae bacterium]